MEKSIIRVGREPGKVQFNAEMKVSIQGQVFDEISDFQFIAACRKCDPFGDAQRDPPSIPVAVKLNLCFLGTAADFGRVRTLRKIAPLHGCAINQVTEVSVIIKKMVDQALFKVRIVLESILEPRLFKNDAVMNACAIGVCE